ncbi:crispr-associated protein cas6 [Geobacillus stearothermophilus]|nr:crispr-associated protein cas6 [Geobacillus stearothermophilus]
MRLTCSFKVERMPVSYRMMLVSMIKEALRVSDEQYYERLYDSVSMKPFSFSTYLKNFRFADQEVYLEGITITVSSPDHEFLLHLYNGLQQKQVFLYKHYQLVKEKIRMLPEKTITDSTAVFRTLSPMLVEDKNQKPVSPDAPDYEEHVNYLADLILRQYRGNGLLSPLIVRPLRWRKVVVKETNHEFEATHGGGDVLYFTAYQTLFSLTGHPTDLQLLYQLGLSKRRNQGFGLLEVEEVRG